MSRMICYLLVSSVFADSLMHPFPTNSVNNTRDSIIPETEANTSSSVTVKARADFEPISVKIYSTARGEVMGKGEERRG